MPIDRDILVAATATKRAVATGELAKFAEFDFAQVWQELALLLAVPGMDRIGNFGRDLGIGSRRRRYSDHR